MKEKKYVVGVDLGTTSTKTVIFDFEGNVVGAGQVENPLYYPASGRQECDGDELIHVILDATRLAVKDADYYLAGLKKFRNDTGNQKNVRRKGFFCRRII